MNLYSRKQTWKLVLLFTALVMVGASLWYSGRMVEAIRKDERIRIQIWSEAVKTTVNQLYVTTKLFDRLREEERKKVKLWAKATQELGKDLPDYTFAIEVVRENTTVPVILTDNRGRFSSSLNLDISQDSIRENLRRYQPDRDESWYRIEARRLFEDTLQSLTEEWKSLYPPIEISYRGKVMNTVYYRESKLIGELEAKKDSLYRTFRRELVKNQALVPVIFTDSSQRVVIESNFDSTELNTPGKLQAILAELSAENTPIRVQLNETESGYIFYRNSEVLNQLRFFPYVQVTIVTFFMLIAYLLFSTFRRAEQNQVWAGMAKETAHQLGTPLSSLMAWIEILRAQGVDEQTLQEMNKDIDRLQTVTERFSKIGSSGELSVQNVYDVIRHTTDYLRLRISKKVQLTLEKPEAPLYVKLNVPLFEWVIENLIKNAVDAMEGNGAIEIRFSERKKAVYIDISDTGKGIPANRFQTIFQPGYTTKKRGWGLGLTLVKRIVNFYHKGSIFVLRSELQKGTTFRIVLKKQTRSDA